MMPRTLLRTALLAPVLVLAAAPARAQTPVATFAVVVGTVEVQRGGRGDWSASTVGSSVSTADSVRTAPDATAKLVFVDDVVLDVGAATELTIESYSAGRKGPRRSQLHLAQGGMEAWVGGYSAEGARFEVETPTAVVRVQGTDFVVRYDPAEKATDVVGIEGTVTVQGTTGIIGPGVAVGPNEMTHVPRDGFPSPAKALDPAKAATYFAGLRRIGTGGRDTLDVDNPIVDGRVVGPDDRPEVVAAGVPAPAGPYLRPGVPGQTLVDSLSPDIRANNQPLPVYRAVNPIGVPAPPH